MTEHLTDSTGNESDTALIERCHAGDSAAVDILLEKYKYLVRKKARTLYLIGGENDDLIQEGMIALFKAVRDFDPSKERSFAGYAEVCIENALYNVIKGANRLKNSPLNSYISLYTPLDSSENASRETLADTLLPNELMNPEDILIEQENVTDIQSAIKKRLSRFEKEVVELYIDGCDYHQIAEKLGKSAKSIDNALQRIKKKMWSRPHP